MSSTGNLFVILMMFSLNFLKLSIIWSEGDINKISFFFAYFEAKNIDAVVPRAIGSSNKVALMSNFFNISMM